MHACRRRACSKTSSACCSCPTLAELMLQELDTSATWLRRLSGVAVLLAFAVVVIGAYVRLTTAGLGCPDWPGCYGKLTPSAAAASPEAQAAYAERPLETGKAWREMVHRYAAGTLAVVIVAIGVLTFVTRRRHLASLPLAVSLVGIVIVQAILGMLTVTWQLKPLIVTAHLLFGMTTLALLFWLILSLPSGPWRASHAGRAVSGGGAAPLAVAWQLTFIGLIALCVQIALGGWTSSNYAALGCP